MQLQVQFEPGQYTGVVAAMPATPGHFELIHSDNPIQQFAGSKLSGIAQVFTLTSFDSGRWFIPPLAVKLLPSAGNKSLMVYSDSIPITVSFSQSDTTTQLKDIKPVRAAKPESNWLYWLIAIVCGVVLVVLAVLLYRHFGKQKTTESVVPHSKLSAIDEAMQALQALQQQVAGSNFQQRLFFTALVNVLKRYLYRKEHVDYSYTTTGDLLLLLQHKKLSGKTLTDAAAALRLADAVKFAKYEAGTTDCLQSIAQVKQAISSAEENSFTPKA